jgi:F-type H+-transporting ATPase subunit b
VKISGTKRLLSGLMLGAMLLTMSVGLRAQEPSRSDVPSGQASTTETLSQEANQEEHDQNEAYRHSAAVKAIGAKLGLNADQAATAFEFFNFALLALGVGWVMVRMLPKTFRDRNSAIQKHLVDARTATEEATARLSSVEERLSKLDDQIAAMRAQAELDSAADEQRIKASVEDEKKKILAAAEQEISSATVQAQRAIQQYAAELAIDQAAKKLVVSAETDRLLIQGFARRLAGDDSKEGQN